MSSYRACDPYNCAPTAGRLSARAGGSSQARLVARLGAVSGAVALLIAGYAKRERVLGLVDCKDPRNEQEEQCLRGYTTDEPQDEWSWTDQERCFNSANQQHFYHSLALMAVPYGAKSPMLTSSLLASGMVLFCGTQYFRAFSKDNVFAARPLLWMGGLCLISAWFTFLL